MPREAATAPARRSDLSPCTVALHRLCGLRLPRHLVSTFWTPAASRIARTLEPAITPVPGDAGLSMTRPAPNRPTTTCGMLPPRVTGTWNMVRLADSPAL